MSVWLFTGLAVLTAGVLAALQYLRVRPGRIRVVTTLFWRQAVDQARARTLFKRFRHPRTYLLLLAASLLVLLALAGPVFRAARQPHRVVVLEAGLAMTSSDRRFDNALALVRAEAASLGEERVAVLAADPHPRLLKHFDESLAVLENRLARVSPADAPVIRDDLLRTAKSLLAGRENGEVVLVAAQAVTVGDDAVRVLAAGEPADNAFILSAVFVPNSADPTRGEFHCRVGFTGRQAGTVSVVINRGGETLLEHSTTFEPGEVKGLTIPGIDADGRQLTASVGGLDTIEGDNRITFQLPARRRIQVVPVDGQELPPVMASVLDSLPEVTTDATVRADRPAIRVGPAGSDAEIRIQPGKAAGELQPIRATGHPLLGGMTFEDAVCPAPGTPLDVANGNLPLLLVNSSALATWNPGNNQLTVSESIFDEGASLVRRTGYMVFWSNMLHHLSGWRDEPLTLTPVLAARSTDAASTDLVMKAGMGNFDLLAGGQAARPDESGGGRLPAWQYLLLAALALMLVEAVLNLRGKIS